MESNSKTTNTIARRCVGTQDTKVQKICWWQTNLKTYIQQSWLLWFKKKHQQRSRRSINKQMSHSECYKPQSTKSSRLFWFLRQCHFYKNSKKHVFSFFSIMKKHIKQYRTLFSCVMSKSFNQSKMWPLARGFWRHTWAVSHKNLPSSPIGGKPKLRQTIFRFKQKTREVPKRSPIGQKKGCPFPGKLNGQRLTMWKSNPTTNTRDSGPPGCSEGSRETARRPLTP